jgi:GNAT superfamily N-acetyltransferase
MSAVVAMVRRCSKASLIRRFHGPSDGIAFTIGQLRRPDDIVLLAWEDSRCAGMGVLARRGNSPVHMGVLVEDERQGRGIGTCLATALTHEAVRRGVRSIRADLMGENYRLVAALRRLGTTSVELHSGTFSVNIDLQAQT